MLLKITPNILQDQKKVNWFIANIGSSVHKFQFLTQTLHEENTTYSKL